MRSLLVAEVAIAIVLLTGSGLLLNSFVRLISLDPGMAPEGVLSFRLTLPTDRYPTPAAQELLYTQLAERVRALPTVESIAAANFDMQGMPIMFGSLMIDGVAAGGKETELNFRRVTPTFFRSLRIPLRAGRDFSTADREAATDSVIVNEAFARQYLKGSALGRTISFSRWSHLTVVGVVADTRETLTEPARATLYLPPGPPFGTMAVFVRTSSTRATLLPPVREILRDIDPNLAPYNAYPLDEMYALTTASPQLYGMVAIACGVIALGLAAIGLYGMLAYFVEIRTHEIGIRMALGADRRMVVRDVLSRGLLLAGSGATVGLLAALYMTRFLQTLLFEVTASDPTTLSSTMAVFVVVALIACYVPARRATRVDPAVSLRAE